MTCRLLLALGTAPVALVPALAQAQIAPDTIVVTANRTERPASQVGESVTVVTGDEIRDRQAVTTIDILRTVPGVTFNQNGGIGTTTGLSIRGAESDQTVALIDGVKLNDPAAPGAGFNFGPLMIGNIDRIEVVRGSQSVLYGSQAIGGVVNLITRQPTGQLGLFAQGEYGANDTFSLVGNVSGSAGPVKASLGANWLRSDGISAFNAQRGGTERDGFETYGANAKVEVTLSDELQIDLRGFYTDATTAVDGFTFTGFGDTNEVNYAATFVGYAGLRLALLDGRLRNRLGFAYTSTDRSGVDLSGSEPFVTFDANAETKRYEYQGVFDLADSATVTFGAEREEASYRLSSYGSDPATARAWTNGVYGQLNLRPVDGLSLTGGVRYEDHQTYGGETTFAASGVYSPNGGSTQVRASYGEGFKAPSLFQLFSEYGNAALRPETAKSWDAGVTQSLIDGRAQIGVTYFERDTRDLVTYIACFGDPAPICTDRPFGTYDNVALARATGWEVGLALRPADGFDVALNFTAIDAFDETTGNRLARRAQHKASLVADYTTAFGLGLGATVLVVGDSFDNAANTIALDGYALVDLRASFAVTDRLELFGRVENVFDQSYETLYLYGQQRRAAFGGARFRM